MKSKKIESLEERLNLILEWPMLAITLILIPVITIPILFSLAPPWQKVLYWIDILIWATFYIELFLKLLVSKNRLRTLKKNWLLVIILLVPAFRAFRLVRIARTLSVIRVLRLHPATDRLKEKVRVLIYNLEYVSLAFIVIVGISAFVVWQFELKGAGAIISYSDALWWAAVTITTVGYGDVVPTTAAGRIFGALLSLVGIILFMLIVAKITSIFVRSETDSAQNKAIGKLLDRIERLEKKNSARK